MNFVAFLKRFASALTIIFACISLMGLAIYFYYKAAFGLTLCAAAMAISTIFQVVRLWDRDKARAMIMLVTTVLLIVMLYMYF